MKNDPSNFFDFKPIECFVHFRFCESIGRFFKFFIFHMLYYYMDVFCIPFLLIFVKLKTIKNMKFLDFKLYLLEHVANFCNMGLIILYSFAVAKNKIRLPRTIVTVNIVITIVRAFVISIRYATTN